MQKEWIDFKAIIDKLFVDLEYNKVKVREQWNVITQKRQPLVRIIREYYFNKFEKHMLKEYKDEFYSILNLDRMESEINTQNFIKALLSLNKKYEIHMNFLQDLDLESDELQKKQNLSVNLSQIFSLNLIEIANLNENIYAFYRKELIKFMKFVLKEHSSQIDQSLITESRRTLIENEPENFQVDIYQNFFQISIELGFYTKSLQILNEVLVKDIQEYIESQQEALQNNTPILKRCISYFSNFHLNFLQVIAQSVKTISSKEIQLEQLQGELKILQDQLLNKIYEIYGKICIQNIFRIVLEFPESYELVQELKEIVEKTNLIYDMCDFLSSQISQRLLIPGVITTNILSQYINCLQILQIIDLKALILEKVTFPIKNYLLKRNDTLRCIIEHLTDDKNTNKLVQERLKIPSKFQSYDLSSDEDENEAEKWEVQYLNQKKSEAIKIKYQESDLLSILVNLYGSQESFISEYQNMLAEKMMGTRNFDIDEEIKNLELLKLRCGDYSLQTCNIIVKDVKDSKRIDNLIHSYKKPINPEASLKNPLLSIDQLHCMFVSKGYWPINYEVEGFPLPSYLEPLFSEYAKRFERNRAMRKLIWHTNLGHVNLTLSFDNGEFEFKCLPIHAILIGYFDETRFNPEKGVSSDFLSQETQLSQNQVKQKMAFWVHKGVVREFKKQVSKTQSSNSKNFQGYNEEGAENADNDVNVYFPVRVYEKFRDSENLIYCEDEENEMILRDQSYIGFENTQFIKYIENLIISILNKTGPRSASQLHCLLKTLYKTDLEYPVQEDQIKDVLRSMSQKHKLIFNGEDYSLPISQEKQQ
ncbi:hypothetical protein ABPG72_002315 [Tetrahymena utriculariae]